MDLLHLAKAAVLGIVEGITEFLPVSSTGHLILAGEWLDFDSGAGKVFEVVIQLGAILAVCWLYRAKIVDLVLRLLRREPVAVSFTVAVLIAFVPSVIFGLLFLKTIKTVLFNVPVVAGALVVGGLIILWVEDNPRPVTTQEMEKTTWWQALIIGVTQLASMIPGTSRSGATIVGGMLGGLSRTAATEFTFFLAIPTMLGASVLDLAKNGGGLTANDVAAIAVGFVVSFVSAVVVVKFLIRFVAHHTLRVFAWYRIVFGLFLAALYLIGHV